MRRRRRLEATRYYAEDQFQFIMPYINFQPHWLLLGGPADGNEAQYARRTWKGIGIVAVEPNDQAVEWQRKYDRFPSGKSYLIEKALWSEDGKTLKMSRPNGALRSASLESAAIRGRGEFDLVDVTTVTFDTIEKVCGHFSEAIMWLDLEGSELEACRGASGLFKKGAVRVVNVEVMARRPDENRELELFFESHGLALVGKWNVSETCEDRVYAR